MAIIKGEHFSFSTKGLRSIKNVNGRIELHYKDGKIYYMDSTDPDKIDSDYLLVTDQWGKSKFGQIFFVACVIGFVIGTLLAKL